MSATEKRAVGGYVVLSVVVCFATASVPGNGTTARAAAPSRAAPAAPTGSAPPTASAAPVPAATAPQSPAETDPDDDSSECVGGMGYTFPETDIPEIELPPGASARLRAEIEEFNRGNEELERQLRSMRVHDMTWPCLPPPSFPSNLSQQAGAPNSGSGPSGVGWPSGGRGGSGVDPAIPGPEQPRVPVDTRGVRPPPPPVYRPPVPRVPIAIP